MVVSSVEWDWDASESELERLMEARKATGITSIGLTFYGLRDFHDRWAGRNGDWDLIMMAARVSAELGLHRQETIFLSKDNIGDIHA